MNVKQISVFMDNKPGSLYEIAKVFADNNISIRALTVTETSDFSVVRVIVDNVLWASSVLKDGGFFTKIQEVIAAEVPNTPGGLNKVLGVIRDADVNIEYTYTILTGRYVINTCMILKLSDNLKAIAALKEAGIKILEQEEFSAL
ncbi:MAG: ACT domain-containing protein [Synergistaceae bacterium]|nr:ACT domain-containing protein [Synergistaceae bacterium]